MAAFKRFLIRVYGDSLSMPRETEAVRYFQTYGELISEDIQKRSLDAKVTLYNRSFSEASAPALLAAYRSDAFYFGTPGGDFAVLQCGVVDCAPRPLPPKLRSVISRLPATLRNPIVNFLHKNRASLLRNGLLWRTTPPGLFLESMSELVNLMTRDFSRVYVINIAPTTAEIEARSPGFSESIELYNGFIDQAVKQATMEAAILIDVHHAILARPAKTSGLISELDGHHITPAAHQLYADAILEYERKLVNQG